MNILGRRPVIDVPRQASFFDDFVPREAGYRPPERMRSFVGLPRIGLDIETFDPDIKTKGPGPHRPEGKIVGVGIAYTEEDATYYPTGHNDTERCMPAEPFYAQLRDEAAQFEGEIAGARLQYDLNWLAVRHKIYFPKARILDCQIAEPLLDEHRRTYSLNSLGASYLNERKKTDRLAAMYGAKYIEAMHKVDPAHAGEYCEWDATLAWRVIDKQLPRIEEQGLSEIFDIESALPPLLVHMREHGVRVDVDRAAQVYEDFSAKSKTLRDEIKAECGVAVAVWEADSIARAFDRVGIEYPRTPKTNKPSFTKEWLSACDHPVAKKLQRARTYTHTADTFIKSYILESHHNGRLYCEFNQLRSDGYGTVSGRFSSSNPNLQNIPIRDPEIGPIMRSMFLPEEGYPWGSADWSQIEYRFMMHFANRVTGIDVSGPVEAYRNDPNTSFHKMAQEITGVDYRMAKGINFGVAFGMGVPALAALLGVSIDEATKILDTFHTRAPFLKQMLETAGNRVSARGQLRTILGRIRRFPHWEIRYWIDGQEHKQVFPNREEAEKQADKLRKFGRVSMQRAFTHKALNAVLQGSNADIMKAAMVTMWKEGLFNGDLVPHLTVHDEFNVSVIKMEAFEHMAEIMRTIVTLDVPILVDAKTGANWNEAH